VEGVSYPAGVLPVRIPCSGLLGPEFIIKAFEKGADGVIVTACKPSDMRRVAPSRITETRLEILRGLLEAAGVRGKRLQIAWISSQEGTKFSDEMSRAVDEIAALGPMKFGEATATV